MIGTVDKLNIAVIAFPDEAVRELRNEAVSFAIKHGQNAYSDYILKHCQRPDPKEAATIGRLIGMPVKASDGTMQPRPTRAERQAMKDAKEARNQRYRIWDHIARLRAALGQLAQIDAAPASIAGEICASDRPDLGANLQKSLAWLIRFAEEWHGHGNQVPHQTPHVASRSLFRFEKVGLRPDNDP